MGAWDVDVFGNDDAGDWTYGLDDFNDFSYVESALDKVLATGSDYLEYPDAAQALAAIEVVARSQGNWGKRDAFSETVDNWVEKVKLKPSTVLAQKAHDTIARILADQSELAELWKQSDKYDAWLTSVEELKSRVHV
jgi:hypothetical protein